MTQTIEQLKARIAELEEDAETYAKKDKANYELRQQLAASQLHAEQLRREISNKDVLVSNWWANLPDTFCSAWNDIESPAPQHRDTSALDAYVAEKVSAARNIDEKQIAYLFEERSALIRKRKLAVAALEAIAGRRIFIDNLASNVDIAVMTLDAIKESEEN